MTFVPSFLVNMWSYLGLTLGILRIRFGNVAKHSAELRVALYHKERSSRNVNSVKIEKLWTFLPGQTSAVSFIVLAVASLPCSQLGYFPPSVLSIQPIPSICCWEGRGWTIFSQPGVEGMLWLFDIQKPGFRGSGSLSKLLSLAWVSAAYLETHKPWLCVFVLWLLLWSPFP